MASCLKVLAMIPVMEVFLFSMSALKYLFTGKAPLLTKETANSAMSNSSYITAKIEEKIGFKFTNINVTINKYAAWYINDQI